MTSATGDATAQLELVKKATNDANAAKNASVEQTALAKKATNDANAAIISINAAKEETQQATEEANAAKVASEAQTALAKKATDDANTAKNASVAQTALAKAATDSANAAAQAANNAVSGVDAKVKAAVDALVAGAPEALDTLIELANALNNDPNFAATMATELGKKINVSDIVNNLTSGGTGKVLSAEQGKVLKAALDTHNHAGIYEPVFSKNTAFNKNFGTTSGTVCQGNDSRLSDARTPKAHTHKKSEISDFPTSMPASDVPAWAKAASKPSYTASEVGASPSNHTHTGVYQPAGSYAASSHKHEATDITPDSTHRFVTDAEKSTWNGKAAGNHNHDSAYQPKGNYALSSHKHTATDVTEDATHRFVTDSDKTNWNGKAAGNHNHSGVYQPVGNYAPASHKHAASEINEDATHRFMTDEEREKLDGIAAGANNYSHPASHPASMIEESTSRKFMTQDEKTLLSSLGTNAIQVNSQSLGQNGYVKYSNGLLMQWGTRAGATWGAISLYFPTTFYNTDYNIYFTGAVNNTSESFIYAPGYDLNGKYTSYCKVLTRGINSTPAIVWTGWNFTWFAIGRWK